jgi:hypothetical protein
MQRLVVVALLTTVLAVANPGTLDSAALSSTGLGTRNVRQRRAHLFKDAHHLTIAGVKGWVVVRIEVAEARECD